MTASPSTRPSYEDEAFIGSNTSLVAPVKIGLGAILTAASVITQEVAQDSAAFGGAHQVNKEGWVGEIRRVEREKQPREGNARPDQCRSGLRPKHPNDRGTLGAEARKGQGKKRLVAFKGERGSSISFRELPHHPRGRRII